MQVMSVPNLYILSVKVEIVSITAFGSALSVVIGNHYIKTLIAEFIIRSIISRYIYIFTGIIYIRKISVIAFYFNSIAVGSIVTTPGYSLNIRLISASPKAYEAML